MDQRLKHFASCVLMLALLSIPCLALDVEEESPGEKTFDALQKSLLIPGWGQLAEKRYLEGAFFLSAEIFCLVEVFANNNKGKKNYRLYRDAESVDEAVKYRGLTEKYDKRRNAFILAAAGVWAVNLIDIYLILKNKKDKKGGVGVKLEGE
ncbi:MAG: DUF5683 domain-containing protein, partial [Candidatus Aminicenantes bacterium]